MRFLDSLLKAEREIQKRIDQVFGQGAAHTPLEIRRGILDEIENRIVASPRGRVLPFSRITVYLQPRDRAMKEIFRVAFVQGQSLENDIRQLLRQSGCPISDTLEITIDLGDPVAEGNLENKFDLEFTRPEEEKPRQKKKHRPAEVEFQVLKGTAEQSVFRAAKARIYLGRLKEVVNKEGQVIRRNDLAFMDNADEVNSTVGRAHATVYFDERKNEFRIVDEVSKYGTRIFRDNQSIEVPAGRSRGIKLRPGDEIYLGRACLRFGVKPRE